MGPLRFPILYIADLSSAKQGHFSTFRKRGRIFFVPGNGEGWDSQLGPAQSVHGQKECEPFFGEIIVSGIEAPLQLMPPVLPEICRSAPLAAL